MIELKLLRDDMGSGGWSLHVGDGPAILSGEAERDDDSPDGWDRPNEADYAEARQSLGGDTIEATIHERGNGLPDVGDHVAGDDGELYEVVEIGRIHCGPSGSGNYMYAHVRLVDWSDISPWADVLYTATFDGEKHGSNC